MMNKFLLLGALPAVLAGAGHGGRQTTKTVYATQVHTVTSCKPEVTNCPGKPGKPVVVTEIVAVSTTVCAVSEVETTTKAPAGCSTGTTVSDCVHTITKTAAPFTVTTKAPATTITKKAETVSTSTCVHTIPGHGKDGDKTVTTLIPTTITKETVETKYTDCVHTITGATSLLVVTTAIPTTYTICPVKPTGAWPHPGKPDVEESGPKPTGSWGHPGKPDVEEGGPKPTGSWPKPEVTGVAPVKPTGTGAWVHPTATGGKAIVTAGASAFGASGALKMLGAAAAAALLL